LQGGVSAGSALLDDLDNVRLQVHPVARDEIFASLAVSSAA
jgi:hypothetical protein